MLFFSKGVKIVVFADSLIYFIIFNVPVRTSFIQGHTEFKYLNYDNLLLETQALAKVYKWILNFRIADSSAGCKSDFLQVQLAESFFYKIKN